MKYLVFSFLAIPLIASCIAQQGYYQQDYYSSAPVAEVHQHTSIRQQGPSSPRVINRQAEYREHPQVLRPAQQHIHGHEEISHQGGHASGPVVHKYDDAEPPLVTVHSH